MRCQHDYNLTFIDVFYIAPSAEIGYAGVLGVVDSTQLKEELVKRLYLYTWKNNNIILRAELKVQFLTFVQ